MDALQENTMNSRERVLTALSHKEPDRVPFDLGSTLVTGISHKTYRGLLPLLGLDPKRDVRLLDVIQQIAIVDEDALQKLGVDVRGVLTRPSSKWHLEIQEDERSTFLKDQWGIIWRMPKQSGMYYDMTCHPLPGDDPADIDRFPWPDPRDEARWQGLAEEAKALHDAGEFAIILGSTGVTVGLLQTAQWLQGFVDSFTNLAGSPVFMHKLLDKLMELDMAFWESFLPAVGPYLDIVLYADDFGVQNGLVMSLPMYRRYFKPRYQRIFSLIKQKSPHLRIFFHTCGSAYDIIPELIEVGVDILNPVQVSAAHMDTRQLKKEFGADITFWGGGVDTQRVLPHGTPQQVKDEVKRRIEDLAPGGGFVFNTVHNIQHDVPPQNVQAMQEALFEYGRY
jgi:uroporphyrinogen decarboxylase